MVEAEVMKIASTMEDTTYLNVTYSASNTGFF